MEIAGSTCFYFKIEMAVQFSQCINFPTILYFPINGVEQYFMFIGYFLFCEFVHL